METWTLEQAQLHKSNPNLSAVSQSVTNQVLHTHHATHTNLNEIYFVLFLIQQF